jgi:epoxide hydrolase-like predicted phosphatase
MTIRAIVFDIGGVLLRTDDPAPRRQLEQKHGLPPGGAAQLVFDSTMGQAAQRGEVTTATLWQWVQQELKLDDEEAAAFYRQFWAGDGLNRPLMDFIRTLRPAYKTGIISNATDNLLELITVAYPIADAFDVIVGSALERVMKPDPRIYQRCLERLGVLPQEAVFIDDFAHNIAGAQAVGMAGLLYTRAIDVASELQKWGVQPGPGQVPAPTL